MSSIECRKFTRDTLVIMRFGKAGYGDACGKVSQHGFVGVKWGPRKPHGRDAAGFKNIFECTNSLADQMTLPPVFAVTWYA
jgi:hypothetical protein